VSGQWKNTALLAIGACYLARAPWGSEKLSGCSSLLLWVRESNEPHLPVLLGCSLVAERERLRQARLAVGGCALLEPPARLRHRAAAFCRRASSFALRSGHEGPTGEARKKARSGGGANKLARVVSIVKPRYPHGDVGGLRQRRRLVIGGRLGATLGNVTAFGSSHLPAALVQSAYDALHIVARRREGSAPQACQVGLARLPPSRRPRLFLGPHPLTEVGPKGEV
jgi:hypothetical protein